MAEVTEMEQTNVPRRFVVAKIQSSVGEISNDLRSEFNEVCKKCLDGFTFSGVNIPKLKADTVLYYHLHFRGSVEVRKRESSDLCMVIEYVGDSANQSANK